MFRKNITDIDLSIRRIAEKAAEKDDCIRFDIGQPSFDTPEHVKEKSREKINEKQGYSPMLGLEEMREAAAREESIKEEVSVNKEEVMITTGGMGALYSIFAARLGKNDTAVFNDPCWGPYKMISRVNGNRFQQVEYWDKQGKLRDEARKQIKESEMLVVNTPSNPTGKMLDREQAKKIAEIAEDYNTFLVSDEVYHRLNYGKKHYSPAAFTENSAIIGSVSKNHAMTGWRTGWIVDKEKNVEEYAKVSRATTACPPRISQYAAVEALENDSHVEKMRKEYADRKEIVVQRMKDLGWSFQTPQGGIYTFPDTGKDSWQLCLEMVEKGVAMVPGEPMGPNSDTNVRICFGSVEKSQLEKGFEILQEELG